MLLTDLAEKLNISEQDRLVRGFTGRCPCHSSAGFRMFPTPLPRACCPCRPFCCKSSMTKRCCACSKSGVMQAHAHSLEPSVHAGSCCAPCRSFGVEPSPTAQQAAGLPGSELAAAPVAAVPMRCVGRVKQPTRQSEHSRCLLHGLGKPPKLIFLGSCLDFPAQGCGSTAQHRRANIPEPVCGAGIGTAAQQQEQEESGLSGRCR